MENRVSIPNEYFIKERDQAYSDWASAFWRELFQNSIDAEARNIRIEIEDCATDGEEASRITFADDGNGMTLEIMRDVYFSLGKTSKVGGELGGFGRARCVTNFSHPRWRLQSLGHETSGSYGGYATPTALPSPVKGCIVTVEALRSAASRSTLELALRQFLSECQLKPKVLVNGLEPDVQRLERGKALAKLRTADGTEWASVHAVPPHKREGLNHIRVSGVCMHSESTRAKTPVIVEIIPAMSRIVLKAERDSLKPEFSRSLRDFSDRLTIDDRSALRQLDQPKKTVIRGELGPMLKMSDNASLAGGPSSAREPEPETPRVPGMHDALIFDADAKPSAEKRAAKRALIPKDWSSQSKQGLAGRLVLAAWTAACDHAMAALMQSRGLAAVQFAPGICFCDDAGAQHSLEAGVHYLQVNPLLEDGTLAFDLSSDADLRRMLALADHEAGHVLHDYHGESYAALLTDLVARVDQAAALGSMRLAVEAVEALYGGKRRPKVQAMDSEPGRRPAEKIRAFAAAVQRPLQLELFVPLQAEARAQAEAEAVC